MTNLRLLDLFCGAGGAARGYRDAGFDEIVGVDISPQKNYPYNFVQGDAIRVLDRLAAGFSIIDTGGNVYFLDSFCAIHSSPPCQGYSSLRHLHKNIDYPILIEDVRDRLVFCGKPYIIENVVGSPLVKPIMLCGTMFPGLRVIRHRLFESNLKICPPEIHPKHPLCFTYDKRKSHYGKLNPMFSFVTVTGGGNAPGACYRDAMGIKWMTCAEIAQAIPPAYTQFIGRQLLEYLC